METIVTEALYKTALMRVEELLPLVDDNTSIDDKNAVELKLMSDIIIAYEEEYFPITPPALADVIKSRMHERGLTQKGLAELIGVSTSRISDYLTGKSEPTLKVARIISKKLNIHAEVVLGV